jgi:hypothetical protein
MDLYVVIDTKGGGRLLGVFDSRELADRIVGRYPNYYKLHSGRLNQINPEVLDWVDTPDQRTDLEELIREQQ